MVFESLFSLVGLATVLALLTAVGLLWARPWQVLLSLLVVLYVLVAVVYTSFLPLHLAYTKFVVGLFVGLILLVTVWQVQVVSAAVSAFAWRGLTVAALVTAVGGILAWWLNQNQPVPTFAVDWLTYALLGLGLLGFLTSTTPLRLGIGLLLILNGIELFYLTWNPSLPMIGFFALANLLSALATAYLLQVRLPSGSQS